MIARLSYLTGRTIGAVAMSVFEASENVGEAFVAGLADGAFGTADDSCGHVPIAEPAQALRAAAA